MSSDEIRERTQKVWDRFYVPGCQMDLRSWLASCRSRANEVRELGVTANIKSRSGKPGQLGLVIWTVQTGPPR